MSKLFLLNDDLLKGKKRIAILGSGRVALLMFTLMLQHDIEVECFISESERIVPNIMGKRVLPFDELKDNPVKWAVVIATEDMQQGIHLVEIAKVQDVYFDENIYTVINDCVWSFM